MNRGRCSKLPGINGWSVILLCQLIPSKIPIQLGQSIFSYNWYLPHSPLLLSHLPLIGQELMWLKAIPNKNSDLPLPVCLLLASGQSKLWSVSGQFSGQLLTMEYWSALTFYLSLSLFVSKPAMSHEPLVPDPPNVKVHVVQSKHRPKGSPEKWSKWPVASLGCFYTVTHLYALEYLPHLNFLLHPECIAMSSSEIMGGIGQGLIKNAIN